MSPLCMLLLFATFLALTSSAWAIGGLLPCVPNGLLCHDSEKEIRDKHHVLLGKFGEKRVWGSYKVLSETSGVSPIDRDKHERIAGSYAQCKEAQVRAICDRVQETEDDREKAQYAMELILSLVAE
ncbi:hypothetical protein AAG570_001842 [Ranatra chinensis]|uniref:Uncharacterized protein n=1 Tax=Ranatra chinensis TaxID=642074 RepID=A0ABD0YNP7_9HEMI